MTSSLFLQRCLSYLVCLTWIVCKTEGRWPYSYCFAKCCFQSLFNTVRRILVYLPSSFFTMHFLSAHVLHPYSNMGTAWAWKNSRFILLDKVDFDVNDNLLIVFHGFVRCMLTSHSVDKMLLTRYVILMVFHAFVRCMLTSHSVDKMLLTRYVTRFNGIPRLW